MDLDRSVPDLVVVVASDWRCFHLSFGGGYGGSHGLHNSAFIVRETRDRRSEATRLQPYPAPVSI
jgi:hypothetical protein